MEFEIKDIFGKFDVGGSLVEINPIKSGHINDTFLIKTDDNRRYVLQRINHVVFGNPEKVIANKVTVSRHLGAKASARLNVEPETRVLTFIKAKSGEYLYKDGDGNHWNLMLYIEDSFVFLKTPNKEVAYEAGRAFAKFIADTEDLDPALLMRRFLVFTVCRSDMNSLTAL